MAYKMQKSNAESFFGFLRCSNLRWKFFWLFQFKSKNGDNAFCGCNILTPKIEMLLDFLRFRS